ncbi:MAG: hypothetical protein JWO50_605 [Candidatus Kaiserbacteria bacterium]|nr:hypothetical protein [Candidatus Kaiserbacteria bacterium]
MHIVKLVVLFALGQVWLTQVAQADLLTKIGMCESHGQQFAGNGRVLRNRQNPHVVGIFQINEKYHARKAFSLGMNIYTPTGNRAFAQHLFATQGARPWLASAGCWNHRGGSTIVGHRSRTRARTATYMPTYTSGDGSYWPTYDRRQRVSAAGSYLPRQ